MFGSDSRGMTDSRPFQIPDHMAERQLVRRCAALTRGLAERGRCGGNAFPDPNVSTAATKSWCTVPPAGTVSGAWFSGTRFGPDWPAGTVTADEPWLVMLTRV